MTVSRNHEKHVAEKEAIDPLIGEGNIVTSEGARWKKMHKMLAPAFSITHVTNMRAMIAENVMEFRTILAGLAETGEAFELEKYVERLTLDVIGTTTFGHSLDAQAMGHNSSVMRHWEDMTRANMQTRESWRIDVVRNYMATKRRDEAKRKLDTVLTELIEKRFDYVRQNEVSLEKRKDSIIIDLILREYLQETPQKSQQCLDPALLEDVLLQMRALLVGGTGTTTDTVCFTYMLLSSLAGVV